MKNAESNTRGPLDGRLRPRFKPHLPALHAPLSLRYKSFDGVAGLETIAYDYEPKAGAEPGKLVGERILGFMTEPVN